MESCFHLQTLVNPCKRRKWLLDNDHTQVCGLIVLGIFIPSSRRLKHCILLWVLGFATVILPEYLDMGLSLYFTWVLGLVFATVPHHLFFSPLCWVSSHKRSLCCRWPYCCSVDSKLISFLGYLFSRDMRGCIHARVFMLMARRNFFSLWWWNVLYSEKLSGYHYP